jgi:hypothetical protein
MTAATTVTATFTRVYSVTSVTVQKQGNGSGTVTGTGINCGDCTEVPNEGTQVTLTATPASNATPLASSSLRFWINCPSVNGDYWTVVLDHSIAVHAQFQQ